MIVLAFAGDIQLVPDLSLLVHVVMILVMIWILNRTFFRPINRVLEAREKNKGGQSSEAEGILKEASAKESSYKKSLLEAREESYEMIEKERAEAMELKQSKVAKAKEEVAAMLDSEMAELEFQKNSAKESIEEEAQKMAEKISSNLLKTA